MVMEQPMAIALPPTVPAGVAMQDDARAFSPVENEAPLRGWRRLGIVPADGLGACRRALLLGLLAWLPMAIWAAATGQLSRGHTDDSILAHYGVHVRCLIVIPCLVLAEATLHRVGKHIASQFVTSGVVTPALQPQFDGVIHAIVRLRDTSLPWVFALGVAIAWSIADSPGAHADEMSWAVDPDGRIGFGGIWFAYVARPILIALLVGWAWRLVLVTVWMWRVGRLPLAFVATHPDRAGGIAFVENLPLAFALVTFATAAMLVSRWAHEVVHHGALLAVFQPAAIAYAVLWSLALLMPLLTLYPVLWSTRKNALPKYAALVGEQGRLVHRRWIERKPVDDATLLEAEGIGPVADAATLYDAVKNMRPLPIGRRTLLAILVPMAIPFLLLAMLRFPLKSILLTLLKGLT
jgi:hypothetical protein